MGMYKIGIDLGATKILVGVVNENNHIVTKKRGFSEIEKGPKHAVDTITRLVHLMLEELSISKDMCKVGACAPGPVDIDSGTLVDSVNLRWGLVPFRDMLEDALSLPVVLEHDAKASAWGEFHYGYGIHEKSMVYIVVGSGVGAAIIIDGKMYRGLHNYAGEIGFMTIDYDGDSGLTDVPGNVQSFMSGYSLKHFYLKLLKEEGLPAPTHEIDGKYIGKLSQQHDKHALRIVQRAGKALGITVASLAVILDINLYVIGGSVTHLGDLLFEPAQEAVSQYTFKSIAKNIKIVSSTLGDEAALLGCAHVAQFGL